MGNRTCTIDGCEREHAARGWCDLHWSRWRKRGTTALLSIEDRFWSKVDKTGECWIWIASTRNGYGQFRTREAYVLSHRFSYELAAGPIPEGLVIDHICHNPSCVRPAHLRLATPKQNSENRSGASVASKSGVLGVRLADGRWRADVKHNGKSIYIGRFDTIDEAETAVITKRNELFTHNEADRTAQHSHGDSA